MTVFANHGVDLEAFVAGTDAVTEAWAEGAAAIARGFVGVMAARRALVASSTNARKPTR
jgi:hypothetical protein